jgi:hypothetical protein
MGFVMSKYEALPQFLARSPAGAHRLTFGKIEGVLGFKLPKSAYEHEAWWSNNSAGHSHARAWLKLGWRTEAVDLARRKVTFRRAAQSSSAAAPKRDPWGCMAGTVTILPGTDLTAPSGEIWKAEQGRLLNE